MKTIPFLSTLPYLRRGYLFMMDGEVVSCIYNEVNSPNVISFASKDWCVDFEKKRNENVSIENGKLVFVSPCGERCPLTMYMICSIE